MNRLWKYRCFLVNSSLQARGRRKMPVYTMETDVMLLAQHEGKLQPYQFYVLICFLVKNLIIAVKRLRKNTSERRDSGLNLYRGIQIKICSFSLSPFFLSKNILDLIEELNVILGSWDKVVWKVFKRLWHNTY